MVGVPHDVELPLRAMFQKNIGLAGGMAPVRKYLPDLLERVLDRRIDPGLVFDLTLPLDRGGRGLRRDGRAPRDQGAAPALRSGWHAQVSELPDRCAYMDVTSGTPVRTPHEPAIRARHAQALGIRLTWR